jgi:AraC-like DNA-binding protein
MDAADGTVHSELHTADVDEARMFCRTLFYGDLRVSPVGDASGFDFTGDVVRLGPITVGEISYGAQMRLRVGDLVSAYHVLAPLTGLVEARHRGTVVLSDPTRAAVFRPSGDVDLRWSATCRLLSVKVDRAVLDRELGDALDTPAVPPPPMDAGFDLVKGPGRTWAALVRLLHDELRGSDGLGQVPRMAARWRDLVISGLAISIGGSDRADPAVPHRPRPVKRALDAMHAEPWQPFTVVDLARVAGVSVRVLQESFRQYVGMSPLAYLRRLRLDGAHTELSRADPWDLSVTDVAYRWGFTHLGRFAGAYRSRYGESPSQTLRARR